LAVHYQLKCLIFSNRHTQLCPSWTFAFSLIFLHSKNHTHLHLNIRNNSSNSNPPNNQDLEAQKKTLQGTACFGEAQTLGPLKKDPSPF